MLTALRRNRRKIWLIWATLLILVLPVLGQAAERGPLPATDWNRKNLAEIKVTAAKTLTFAVLGDNRDNPEVFGRVLQQINRNPSIAFAIHLGDMVHKANLEQYDTFFQTVRQNFHKPLVAVIGNHELYGRGGLKLYNDLFGPDYFSFQVAGNYFIAVDDANKQVMTPEQFSWLEAELRKAKDYKTRVVFLHIPLFDPSGSPNHYGLPPETAARLLSLFQKYKVDHIFAAHLHGYYAGAWDGLPYTVTGGAGAPLYGANAKHAFYNYLKVTIQGKKVQVQVRRLADPKE